MVTKQTIKDIHALELKKRRDAEGLFVAERPKVVTDLLPLMKCRALYATNEYLKNIPADTLKQVQTIEEVDNKTLEKLSLLCVARDVVAVFEKRECSAAEGASHIAALAENNLCLMLDEVQDPGNLGTIVRLADWYGIEHIIASPNTADVYAPKVVQATMGAIGRINVHYCGLKDVLSAIHPEVPVYGTFLEGENIYEEQLSDTGIIVMGNEGRGISNLVAEYVTKKLNIPPYPTGRETSESLNVAIATAIVCSEFRRRII